APARGLRGRGRIRGAASGGASSISRSVLLSGTVRAGSYRDVLFLPLALRTFVPALLGRLSYGLLPLSLLFTVQQSTNSFATAGAAVAIFGLASLSMPYKARLVDRFSQRRV